MHRMSMKTIVDAICIVLIGAVIGFTFNYVRKDGLSLKKPITAPEQKDASEAAQESGTIPEPVWIDLSDAKAYFEDGEALFIDAREEEEYVEGHIKGAINIPYGWYLNEHPDISSVVEGKKVIITYCSGSECEASIQLAYALWEKGYGGLKIFFGGWQEWIDAGLPVEEGL